MADGEEFIGGINREQNERHQVGTPVLSMLPRRLIRAYNVTVCSLVGASQGALILNKPYLIESLRDCVMSLGFGLCTFHNGICGHERHSCPGKM